MHRCIGRGGFGEVYHATMVRSDGSRSDVAVKVLHPGIDPSAQAIQRLRDEGRLLGVLHHPSIIGVVDMLMINDRLALVTEFVDGEDLSACYGALPPPSPRAMVEIVGRVASALDAAWRTPSPDTGRGQLRLIHRDIKPPNIRVSRAGEVKLLDFGLAHADGAEREAHTADHALLGSFLYMAPERYLQRPATTATDAFGLGCCLYEGLRGEKLFEGFKPVDLYAMLIEEGEWDRTMDERLASIPSTVDRRAVELCRRLLHQAPEDRMTVTQLAEEWEDLVASMSGPTLQKWVKTRTWTDPDAEGGSEEAEYEGSVVQASAVQQFALASGDVFADDEPTVKATVDQVRALANLATEPRGMPAAVIEGSSGGTPPARPAAETSSSSHSAAIVGASVLASATTALVIVVAGLVVLLAVMLLRPQPPAQPPPEEVAIPTTRASARIDVTGVSRAKLTRGSTEEPTGAVRPGTWSLWVDFGEGLERVGSVRVGRGERVAVSCDAEARRCELP